MFMPVPVQVLGGADLFLQGLIVASCGLGDWVSGEVRTISIPGNRYPFAGAQVQPAHAASTRCSQAGCTGMPAYLALSCWLGRVPQGASQGRGGCQAATYHCSGRPCAPAGLASAKFAIDAASAAHLGMADACCGGATT